MEGHTFVQVQAVAQDSLVGGPLFPKLNFWAVFPYSWAETVPSLQLNRKSNVPLGSGKEAWVLTQDQQGDSNSQGGTGIVDWGRKICGNHLHRRWGRSAVHLVSRIGKTM